MSSITSERMAGSWELGGCIDLMLCSVFSQWVLRVSHLEKNGTLPESRY